MAGRYKNYNNWIFQDARIIKRYVPITVEEAKERLLRDLARKGKLRDAETS